MTKVKPLSEQQISVKRVLSLLGQPCSGCNEAYRRRLIRKIKSLAKKSNPQPTVDGPGGEG